MRRQLFQPADSRSFAVLRAGRLLWILLLVAFVTVGSIGLRQITQRVPVISQSTRNSTDTVFLYRLAVKDATARIAWCLADVPHDEPVAIVYWNAPHTQLAAMQLGTLTWPRPAPAFQFQSGEPFDLAGLRAAKATRAIFFLGSGVPTGPGFRSLSPLLHFYRDPALRK